MKHSTLSTVLRKIKTSTPLLRRRPIESGSAVILGSFPSVRRRQSLGTAETFFIHPGYKHRSEATYFDATESGDGYQLEVYQFAREIFSRENLRSVMDIGCGSAKKLLDYFGDVKTIGIDVPETCRYLRRRWPSRQWIEADLALPPPPQLSADMVIASDVIEHLVNPNDLLAFIQAIRPRFIVLSTPDRDLLRVGSHDGPPRNVCHTREWNFCEFNAYIDHHFEVTEHFISFPAQATQCLLGTLRDIEPRAASQRTIRID